MDELRIAVCEDDLAERQSLLQILEASTYDIQVSAFLSGEEFLSKFQPYEYDLILMDIFMDVLTGIDTITKVRAMDDRVPVVFITSSMDYTLESYRLDAIKYIEKPATAKQVEDAIQMAQVKRQTAEGLRLRVNGNPQFYPLQRILYLEQKGRNLMIYLLGGEVVTVNKKLSEVAELLTGKGFLHCHKSYLVNLSHVRGIDRELYTFEMEEGNMVHIRRRGFWEMQKAFETYLFASHGGTL